MPSLPAGQVEQKPATFQGAESAASFKGTRMQYCCLRALRAMATG